MNRGNGSTILQKSQTGSRCRQTMPARAHARSTPFRIFLILISPENFATSSGGKLERKRRSRSGERDREAFSMSYLHSSHALLPHAPSSACGGAPPPPPGPSIAITLPDVGRSPAPPPPAHALVPVDQHAREPGLARSPSLYLAKASSADKNAFTPSDSRVLPQRSLAVRLRGDGLDPSSFRSRTASRARRSISAALGKAGIPPAQCNQFIDFVMVAGKLSTQTAPQTAPPKKKKKSPKIADMDCPAISATAPFLMLHSLRSSLDATLPHAARSASCSARSVFADPALRPDRSQR